MKPTKKAEEPKYVHEVVLVGYDIKSHGAKELSEGQRSFIARMRSHIWHSLRFTHRCVAVWDSLWWVRDAKRTDELVKEVAQWKKAFADNGFGAADINILRVAMTEKGIEDLRNRELSDIVDGLARLERSLEQMRDGRAKRSTLADVKEKLEVYRAIAAEDFRSDRGRQSELKHQFQIVEDGLRELREGIQADN